MIIRNDRYTKLIQIFNSEVAKHPWYRMRYIARKEYMGESKVPVNISQHFHSFLGIYVLLKCRVLTHQEFSHRLQVG